MLKLETKNPKEQVEGEKMKIANITQKKWLACVGVVVMGVSVLSACSSSSNGAASPKTGSTAAPKLSGATLVIGDVWPYTGGLADYGTESQAGCLAAAYVINNAGGADGHGIKCVEVDDQDNPVAAVSAVRKFFATTSHVVGISGSETDSSVALAPVFQAQKVPWLPYSGSAFFLKSTDPYYWNMSLNHYAYGAAMADAAYQSGSRKIAVVVGTDSSAQGYKPGIVGALQELGAPAVTELDLTENQPTYSTEVARLAAAKPDAIVGQLNPTSMATFITDLSQQYHMVPVVTSATDLTPDVFAALTKTIGATSVEQYLHAASGTVTASGPGYDQYVQALNAIAPQDPAALQQTHQIQAEYTYDTVLLYALAIDAAKSTNPQVFNSYITKVANAGAGKTVVSTYSGGRSSLAANKPIQYVALVGPLSFNQYHNSLPPLHEYQFTSAGGNSEMPNVTISLAEINKLVAGLNIPNS